VYREFKLLAPDDQYKTIVHTKLLRKCWWVMAEGKWVRRRNWSFGHLICCVSITGANSR